MAHAFIPVAGFRPVSFVANSIATPQVGVCRSAKFNLPADRTVCCAIDTSMLPVKGCSSDGDRTPEPQSTANHLAQRG